jgi:hypothetical protein
MRSILNYFSRKPAQQNYVLSLDGGGVQSDSCFVFLKKLEAAFWQENF